jgi:hypothetical protein
MLKQNIVKQDRRAAIVCSHVATEHHPILRALRDEPTMPEDSGWQFLCSSSINHEDDDMGTAKVWLICEVLKYESSLTEFINFPPGTILTRKDIVSLWECNSPTIVDN